ncbi:MAG TPA: hypothetical protein DDY78_03685 [Planctomycetales bacterium]|nr:hypothetical protein [Planctomycetales bacterium]
MNQPKNGTKEKTKARLPVSKPVTALLELGAESALDLARVFSSSIHRSAYAASAAVCGRSAGALISRSLLMSSSPRLRLMVEPLRLWSNWSRWPLWATLIASRNENSLSVSPWNSSLVEKPASVF